jgi:hypothetical protein
MKITRIAANRLIVSLVVAMSLGGCNAVGISGEEDSNEARVTVTAVGADYLDADDGFRYQVSGNTEYEGLSGLSDVSVGEIVQIEFEEVSTGTRRALEIEADGPED